ncbi:PREDICTED: protein XRI1 [Fragaria vesca subsp. vesca]|uniref:protein XRI1 n=1 Tax=Fragaria vesca subsp. vesca TaxID=101020 RepID=UPI0002C304AB|nr:PREDICTED: protein XRI1 [Fragaria vesca subsp. vesca]
MGELHSMSMAYSSNSLALGGPGGLGLGLGLGGGNNWDNCHNFNLGVLSSDRMSLVMDDFDAPPFSSTLESDFSTGYLEDALVEFSERSKRRRMLLFNDDKIRSDSTASASKAYWNSDWEMSESFDSISQLITSAGLSGDDDPASMSNTPISKIYGDETNIADTKMNTGEEAIDSSSSSSSCKESANTNSMAAEKESPFSVDALPADEKRKKKRAVMTSRVVYPFAVVKPGGVEGDVTLNDINERISMPPTRPVRHPVGDFACRPCVSDPDGPGLSGKAVVALTRIQTQGRGTITIIRTRG